MKLTTLAFATVLLTTASAGAAAAADGPWNVTASHLPLTLGPGTEPIVAKVDGNGSGPGVFTTNDPVAGQRLSKGTVEASTVNGFAKASLEDLSLALHGQQGTGGALNSASFMDTLSNFDSKTGLVSGEYQVEFKESTGLGPDSKVLAGLLSIDLTINYPTLPADTYSDQVNFGLSDCPYFADVCRTTRTFVLKEVPQSIFVSMSLASSSIVGGGLVNQAIHDYTANMRLGFAEILPCPPHIHYTFCATPVPFQSASAVFGDNLPPFPSLHAVPEPATWALLILGFAGTGAMLRRRRAQIAV